MTTGIEQPTQNEPSQEEAERRLKELQMMDLGTQRREYISTVDAPSRYKNVSMQEIEASRRANVDPRIKSMAEANKQRLSAWNNVHETLGDDVDVEDLDSLMDGQSHRARLYDLVREHGGQSYVEPEPLYNGHSHHPSTSHPHGKPFSFVKKKGEAAITNAAGRTRKALPNLGKYAVELPPAPSKPSSLPSKPPAGKKKSKPTVVSQFDPARNPSLIPGQLPMNAPTAPRAPNPPSIASSTDTKASSRVSQRSDKKPAARPPRVQKGPSVYPTHMADPKDFMKAVEAAMPIDKTTRSPPIAPAAPITSVASPTIPSAPSISSTTSRRSFSVVDDPTTFMIKAASIVAKPRESSTTSSATNELAPESNGSNAPETAKDISTSSVDNIQVESEVNLGQSAHSSVVSENFEAQDDTKHEESTQTTGLSGQVGQTQESVPKERSPPLQEACIEQKTISNDTMPQSQEETMAQPAVAPTADLLDLDFDDTLVDLTPRPPQPSRCLEMMPFTQPPPKTPAVQTPQSSQSMTPKQNRALEAYLRIFVRFRVELRKLRQLSKKAAADDDLQQYLKQRKQEVEEDYNVLWEELTERYPDIDLDEIEEEVLIRSLTVRIKILDADLDQYRKKHEEAMQQMEPTTISQPKPVARAVRPNPVVTTTTPPTHPVPAPSSSHSVTPELATLSASGTMNPVAESQTIIPEAPAFTPSSSTTQIELPVNNGESALINENNFSGKQRSRSSTTASVTPSMASNIFHPGRTSGNVSGLQSERALTTSFADQSVTPTTPTQATSPSYAPPQSTFSFEQPLLATTPGGLVKPVYQPSQTNLFSSFPHYDVNVANRYSSMPLFGQTSSLGATSSSQPYQGLNQFSMNVPMPSWGQSRSTAVRQPPASGLQASRWATAPPLTSHSSQGRKQSSQLETFTAKLQTRGITLKPSNDKDASPDVSKLISEMSKLNGFGKTDHPERAVQSQENDKPPTPPGQSQQQNKFVGLSASKWAS